MPQPEPVIGTGASISYEPVDRLSRLGDMLLKAVPDGNDDVTVVLMLDDRESGTTAYRGYGGDSYAQLEMLSDIATHLVYLGRISGVEIELSFNGAKMPDPPRDTGETT